MAKTTMTMPTLATTTLITTNYPGNNNNPDNNPSNNNPGSNKQSQIRCFLTECIINCEEIQVQATRHMHMHTKQGVK